MPKLKEFFLAGVAVLAVSLFSGCSPQAREARHVAKADRYFDAGQYDAAEIEYLNALKIERNDPHVIGRLGIIYFNEGRAKNAYVLLSMAKKLAPNDLEVRLDLGLYMLAYGKTDAARDEALFVLKSDPANSEAPLLLAESAVQTRDMEGARRELGRLPEAIRSGAPVLVALGNLQSRLKRLPEAEALFQKALQADPKCSSAYSGLGVLRWQRRDNAGAGEFFAKAAEYSPPRSAKRLQYAYFRIQTGDAAGGRKVLEDIISKSPDFLPPRMQLALLDEKEGKLDEAEAADAKVLERDQLYPDAIVLSGRLKLARNEPAKAVTIFENARSSFPHDPVLEYELAQAYLGVGEKEKAESALNLVVGWAPDFSEAVVALAQSEIARGDLPSAVVALKQTVQKRPDYLPARMLLASAYQAMGSYDDALAIYRQLEKAAPNSPEPATLVGVVLMQQQKFDEARLAFERALKVNPDDAGALEQFINLDLAVGDYAGAQRLLEGKIARIPADADDHYLLARVYLAQGGMKKGEMELKRTIELRADSTDAYFLLAEVYFITKQDKQALGDLQKLVSKDPKDTRALMLMGSIQMREKDYPAARASYENVIGVDPNFSSALNNLAYLFSEIFGDLDKGFAMAQRAKSLLPNDPHVADTLGWILSKKHQYDWALSLLQDSAAGLPDDPEAQFHLGMTQYLVGREDAARTSLQRAVRSGADFPGVELARAHLAVLGVDVAKAGKSERTFLEQSAAQHPDDPVVLARLGSIYERQGATKQAIATYEAALAINPKDPTVLARLARLRASQGDGAAAFELAKTAHNLAPDDPEVSHVVGQLAYRAGDFAWAASVLGEAAERAPGDAELLFDLGQANYSLGRVDQAEDNVRAALAANAGFPRASLARRFLELVQTQQDASQLAGEADEVLRSEPAYVPALMVKGANLERNGDVGAAVQAFESVLGVFPNFTPAERRLVRLYAAQAVDSQMASEVATKALDAFPDDGDVAKDVGIIAYRRKEYLRAENVLTVCANKAANDGEVLFYLGMTQMDLKEKQARDTLESSLKLKLPPELEAEAKGALTLLKQQ